MKALRENRKKAWTIIGVLLAVFVVVEVLSFIVIDKSNPAVAGEPNWAAAPQARDLAQRACFDCHSNETVWPWYANFAPSSWLLWFDVHEGRGRLNFSDWDKKSMPPSEIAEVIDEGEMPPSYYLIMHSDAKLSDAEKQTLIDGIYQVAGQAETTPVQPTNDESHNDDEHDENHD